MKIILKGGELSEASLDEDLGLSTLRHSTSHILAEAVKRLYPEAKLAIGPSIDTGFYYDFDVEKPFSREDLDALEGEMKKILKEGRVFKYFELPREDAVKFMQAKGEPYKVELIEDLPEGETISFFGQEKSHGEPQSLPINATEAIVYAQNNFVDLCAGPHLTNTQNLKHYKLVSSSGAYWRGSEKNKMLQRIYGSAFAQREELDAYLKHLEDIKRRDHNRLGREMKLFLTTEVIGQGLPLFTPKGTKMIMKLQRWIEDLEDNEWGYLRTRTPLMAKSDLYKISGHWDHYMDGMFILNKDAEEQGNGKEVMALRPMTCPFQYFVYMNEQHSYRDLPYRMSETSTLFRNEDSGEMHGLTRVRQFTITEAHIILTPEQAEEELTRCVELANYVMNTLGIAGDVTYRLSKWDPNNKEKYLGDENYWNTTQNALRNVMLKNNITFTEADDEAAFYGPKIDIQAKNVYGKEDTMVTIQLDCASAEKFGMYYIDPEGNKALPYIIHRTSMGCYERTLAWLIEHYDGKFPTWLCPEQVRVLPISDKYEAYAEEVLAKLRKAGIDATVDHRSEKLGYKIREARMDRLPYWLIVGEQEEADGLVSVSSRFAGDEGQKSSEEFIAQITEEIRTKTIRKIEKQL